MQERKGFFLVFLTAIVSGVSIFANNFAVQGSNPFVFTFLKNAVVAVLLFSLILLLKEFSSIKSLSRKQLGQLAAIGFIGGSIPFLLFFYALKMTTAINAGFLHKTLFIWATLFAFVFLKEKVSKRFVAAAGLLLAGNSLLFGISSFGFAEALILIATFLWAAENVLAKHVLRELNGSIVAFGRMFFGSVFILAFLVFTSQIEPIFALDINQIFWVLISSAFLFAYVFTFYSGLRFLPVHKATAILLLAQPVTAFLSFAFLGTQIVVNEAFGLLLTVAGIILIAGAGFALHAIKQRGFLLAADRA
jgi:drug/metabolite transporter (DMT)-like permease